ncbi:hypothetical protein GT002_00810 [Streptomyces sp. SID4917]|nr:hypothetical protein [Streptomyces sp. SID4917]SCF61151.1 hypothetical protein GA0115259_100142 [Streptomyces sp. MnatMP-M17]
MLAAGQRISFARVAREANVSTWFVYNSPEAKTAIRDAMHEQTHHGVEAAAVRVATVKSTRAPIKLTTVHTTLWVGGVFLATAFLPVFLSPVRTRRELPEQKTQEAAPVAAR